MPRRVILETLDDPGQFRERRARAWERNIEYWLKGPLRHVVDVGDYIIARVSSLCKESPRGRPTIVDMGCGDAWLLRALQAQGLRMSYVGLDWTQQFIDHAYNEFRHSSTVCFERLDLERPVEQSFDADVVVNSFSFFEYCDLPQGFSNASRFLSLGGTLLMSTIDKTYLLLALSEDWPDFLDKLKAYQELPGIKYAFQPIDLGNAVSVTLEYPSVLYSVEDYLQAAREAGLVCVGYKEHIFTARRVPKIYYHLEFKKIETSCNSNVRM